MVVLQARAEEPSSHHLQPCTNTDKKYAGSGEQVLGIYAPNTFPYQITILYFLFWFSLL